MKVAVYKKSTVRTLPDLGSLSANLSHMVEGMSSELAELQRCLNKKATNLFDKINLGEEVADGCWYGFNLANIRGIEIPDDIFDNLEQGYEVTDILINIGELADISKRFLAYKTPFDVQEQKRRDNTKEIFRTETEMLHDYLKSLGRVALAHDINIEEILGKNILKLYVRYPDKFSEDAALIRDLEAERAVLESNMKEAE